MQIIFTSPSFPSLSRKQNGILKPTMKTYFKFSFGKSPFNFTFESKLRKHYLQLGILSLQSCVLLLQGHSLPLQGQDLGLQVVVLRLELLELRLQRLLLCLQRRVLGV